MVENHEISGDGEGADIIAGRSWSARATPARGSPASWERTRSKYLRQNHQGMAKLSLQRISNETLRCHQTWRAGKWTIEICDFPVETSIQFGDFLARFDDTGG